jgi:hypothetical protein
VKPLSLSLTLLCGGLALAAPLRADPPARVAPAAAREAKPVGALSVRVTLESVTADAAVAVVRVGARRDSPAGALAVSADPGVGLDGAARWRLPAMAAGQRATYRVRLRRESQDGVGRRVFAAVTAGTAGGHVGEGAVAWVFGPVDPARVLPRSGATLGPNGVGALGPNDRVIRTPAGERLHETLVP